MENKTIEPVSALAGVAEVPGDKSISHRAVILSALSDGLCEVDNFLDSEDCARTVTAFRQMGVSIEQTGRQLRIRGQGLDGLSAPHDPINCGNSGTTARLLMGVLTGQPFEARLVGDASLSRRPMDRVTEPLSQMGAFFLDMKESRLPLRMRGAHSVRTLQWKTPVASAQVKSTILLAGLYASGPTSVEEPALSRDHTERMLEACGVKIERSGARVTVHGVATVGAQAFKIPNDPSSAAFVLAAGVLKARGEIRVKSVGVNPTRVGFMEVLKAMGAECRYEEASTRSGEPVADMVVKASALNGVSIGGDMIPRLIDEIPILAVLATQAVGLTVISNASELRVKESDRLAALRTELSKMGARIEERQDGLVIEGPTVLQGAVVNSHGDHRLAMSLAIAGLVAKGPTTIKDIGCVATSFPAFWDVLARLRVQP